MGTHLQLCGQVPVLLVALMFFTKGALSLECHSCVDRGDGGCSEGNIKQVTCPASTHVCVETVAAVEWSHGKFSVGEKGCGLGMPGTNDKAVDLHGILAFSQLRQCNDSNCNTKLDIKTLELQPMDNESARVPNGVECYSCVGNECSVHNSSIVKCYDAFRGCFHGNVTMRAGNFSLTRPIKGCVKDEECTKVKKGSHAITLVGSCCNGSLCNVNLSNKTHFSSKIPQLTLLPKKDASTTTSTPPSTSTHVSVTASSAVNKHPITAGPSKSSHDDQDHDHDHDHDHNHDHDHDHGHHHNGDDEEFTPARDGSTFTAVKVEERHNQQAQSPHGPGGNAANLSGSILPVLLLAALLM
nr:ly6/PLAUR domain-containing protein 3-like [Pogona vitticeps]